MLLRGPQRRFELNLVPGAGRENWCRIDVRVETPEARWTAADVCLKNDEVSCLAGWLEAAAVDQIHEREIDFLEPELSFAFPENNASLRVCFRDNLRPPWLKEEVDGRFFQDYPVTPADMQRAAASQRAQLLQGSKRRGG